MDELKSWNPLQIIQLFGRYLEITIGLFFKGGIKKNMKNIEPWFEPLILSELLIIKLFIVVSFSIF